LNRLDLNDQGLIRPKVERLIGNHDLAIERSRYGIATPVRQERTSLPSLPDAPKLVSVGSLRSPNPRQVT
jgi:hypothetical protein